MKLMIPVAGIVFASGVCCCGDLVSKVQEMAQEEMNKEGVTVTTGDGTAVQVGDGGTTVTTGSTTASASGAGGLETVSGACGRFGTMGVKGPSGFSIMACSDTGNSAALVLTGSGDPSAICKPLKDWVEGAGYTVTVNASMGGTASIVSQKGGERFVVACTNSTGPTLVSYSLSSG